MSNFQNTNNNSVKKTKSSRGIQFYNSNNELGSTISLDFWQAFVNVKINPMLPKEKRTSNAKYDYDNNVGILLPVEKVYDLIEAWKYVAFNVAEGNYNFDPAGVATARGDNLIQIEPMSTKYPEFEEAQGICVTIYNNIESGIAGSELTYIFNKSSFIKKYDPKSGYFEKSQEYEAQFMIFGKFFENAIDALTMAYTHAQAMHDMYLNDSIKDSLYQLKQKAGITSGNYNKGGNNNYSNSNFSGGNVSNFPSLSAPSFDESNVVNGGIISSDRLNLDD